MSRTEKSIQMESILVVARDWREGGSGKWLLMDFFNGVMKTCWRWTVVKVAQLCEILKITELQTLKG